MCQHSITFGGPHVEVVGSCGLSGAPCNHHYVSGETFRFSASLPLSLHTPPPPLSQALTPFLVSCGLEGSTNTQPDQTINPKAAFTTPPTPRLVKMFPIFPESFACVSKATEENSCLHHALNSKIHSFFFFLAFSLPTGAFICLCVCVSAARYNYVFFRGRYRFASIHHPLYLCTCGRHRHPEPPPSAGITSSLAKPPGQIIPNISGRPGQQPLCMAPGPILAHQGIHCVKVPVCAALDGWLLKRQKFSTVNKVAQFGWHCVENSAEWLFLVALFSRFSLGLGGRHV